MATSPNRSPRSSRMTPEGSNGEQPHSGFTAVNGTSSSQSSSPERPGADTEKPIQPQEVPPSTEPDRGDSQTGLGKRKDSAEPSPTSSEATSQKRQRTADAGEPDSAFHARSESLSSHTRDSPANHEPHHDHHPNESPWGMHARNASMNSDSHMAEMLQHGMTSDHMGPVQPPVAPPQGPPHHDPRFPIVHSQPSHYAPLPSQMHTPTSISGSSMQQKQRKRNFSNRTKTGCFTCRERKKKCDEGKPTCNNCARGGFTCKGYATNAIFKSSMPRDQPPLQAKNGYYDPHRYQQAPVAAPNYYDLPQPDGRKAMPMEDGRDPARSIPPPQEPTLGSSYGPQGWPEQSVPQQYPRESLPRVDYQAMPPLRDVPSQQQKSISHPPPVPIHPSHNRSMSQHTLANGQSSQYINGQPPLYMDQRMMAQSALDHSSNQHNLDHLNLSERQKMARGMPFQHNDPSLKEDREACAKEVYRFNKNAIDPRNLSEGARREQFRQIIEVNAQSSSPGKGRNHSPSSDRKLGHLGLRVEVEAPFYCDYGYNLKIGSDVEIGPNCRIMDSGHIEIGDRTILGPNVTIITLDCDHHAARGPKEKRLYRAKRIIIGEDVFIGAGAIVLPGVSIHKGATIGAGTIVHKNIDQPISVVNTNEYHIRTIGRRNY